ncbi:MAG: anhydro-N-acetylmuramic acid kinase [Alphaproteobacteria bacterium]|nr:anhydro-N-acetylmuramic acid kinase [Alphaproteobacteria bacterium]
MASKIFKAIGLMSGTSMDGVDAAIIKTDGENILSIGSSVHIPYSKETKQHITNILGQSKLTDEVKKVELEITQIHIQAVKELINKETLIAGTPPTIDVIGFHGHTIHHSPKDKLTIQIGEADLLAKETGIKVVHQLRINDIKAGGQGAPLVPIYHAALASSAKIDKPTAFVNIGGIANVTWIGKDDELIAFDTGMGNALINDWMMLKSKKAFDKDGKQASKGYFHRSLLDEFLSSPYFDKAPPKSLDRNDFAHIINKLVEQELDRVDGAATLTAFTAKSIAFAFEKHLDIPKSIIICGGGRHNKTMMKMLNIFMPETTITNIDSIGITSKPLNGDMTEAEAFAFLAVRSILKLPLTFSRTTGVPSPITGGAITT